MPLTSFTLNDFVNNLADLSITGVTVSKDGPPANAEAMDLPMLFPRAASGSDGPITAKSYGGWPLYRTQLVILVQKVGLDTVMANHAAVVDIIDNFQTALMKSVSTASYGPRPLEWQWKLSSEEVVGDTPYWAVVITVSQV